MRSAVFLFFIFICPVFSFQILKVKKIQLSGFAQGTTYHITYYAADSIVTPNQIDSIIQKIDSSLSWYKPYSLINQFNKSDSGIVVDDHFVIVVKKSIKTWQETKGVFDITIQPLVQVWGFGSERNERLPDSATVRQLLKCVGSQWLLLQKNKLIKLKPCIKIDVNGIAQGYTVDVLANFLERNRIKNFLVELGGEVRVKGRKQPENKKMDIGIEAPGGDELELGIFQKIVSIESGAITTSGNYRRFYESEGKKITHILDPGTGYSVQNELISVSVYAKNAITADAYDNSLMVMGLTKGLQFSKQKNLAAYFIYRRPNGTVADTASPQFYKLIKK